MLLYALITLALSSIGAILGLFALQGKVRAWRLLSTERTARARWARMNPAEKTQVLKTIGVFPLSSTSPEALDQLFDGVLASARGAMARGSFDFQALNGELDRALTKTGLTAKGRLAHG